MSCIFCRIVSGEIPAEIVAREADAVAFLDVQPLADGHVLIVPRSHVPTIEDLDPAAAESLFRLVTRLARPVREALGADGTTIGVNNGEATGQTIAGWYIVDVPHVIMPHRLSDPDVALLRYRSLVTWRVAGQTITE